MAATLDGFRDYAGLSPDVPNSLPTLCFRAAEAKFKNAGVPQFKNNPQYDLAVYALAAFYYDNGGLVTQNPGAADAAQNMLNSFILELRYAEDWA